MPPTFGHGKGFGALFNGHDLTRFSTAFNFGVDLDTAEQTTAQAPGGAKEFLYGNNGASSGLDGQLARSLVDIQQGLAAVYGADSEPKLFALAPFGFAPGNWAVMFRTMSQTYRVNGGLGSLVGTGQTFQAGSAFHVGRMLSAPRLPSNAAITRNEVQTLNFNGASPYQFLGLRALGTTTPVFAFRLVDYADDTALKAALKTGIESLYAGRTVTITGTLTGSATKTGILTVTFNGAVNLPQLQAISGVVDSFIVSGGSGNYTLNGGATFTMGVTEGALQPNQRALGGQSAGVVVKGASSAPVAGADLTGPGNGQPFGLLHDGADPALLFNNSESDIPALDPGYGVGWDFGVPTSFKSVRIKFAQSGLYPANDFQIRTSNTGAFGGEENVVYDHSGAAPGDVWLTLNFADQQKRFVQIYNNSGGIFSLSEMEVVNGNTGGNASFDLFYPLGATPAAPTKTGTGATVTRTLAAGAYATTVVGATIQEGGTFTGVSVISGATNGTPVKTALAPHVRGATLDLHATYCSTGTLSVPVVVEHAPDVAGAAGAWSTLGTFTTVTSGTDANQIAQRVIVPKGTTINPWKRFKVATITGSAALGILVADRAS